MKKLRVAIIGQGRSGRDIHGEFFHRDTERFEVVAVVDRLEERRTRAKLEYGCEVYGAYSELFGRDDIDIVVNASFSHQHGPITMDLLAHGLNVLVEKPAAGTPQQLQAMVDMAKAHGVMLALFQQSRFAPYFEQVQQVIASGVLGRLVQISIAFSGFSRRWDWQTCQDHNGGNLFNTGPHPLDQALHLLDCPDMPEVFCQMDRANTSGDAEDYVKLILTARDRPLVDLEISSCDAYPSATYKLQGTQGGLQGNMTRIDWRYFDPKGAPAQRLIRQPLANDQGLPLYCGEQLPWVEGSWEIEEASTFTYAVRRLYDTVYDHLTCGTPLVVTPEQVMQQLAVIVECHRQNPLSRMIFAE